MYQNSQKMKVQKRNGSFEEVSFDKIVNRIKSLSKGNQFLNELSIDETLIAQKVIQEIYDGVKTSELDELSSQIAISMYSKNPEFKTLASRIIISNHHKNTLNNFTDKIELMYHYNNNGVKKPLIADYFYEFFMSNKDKINEMIDYSKDYDFDFFGFKTLEKSYLYSLDKKMSMWFECASKKTFVSEFDALRTSQFTFSVDEIQRFSHAVEISKIKNEQISIESKYCFVCDYSARKCDQKNINGYIVDIVAPIK